MVMASPVRWGHSRVDPSDQGLLTLRKRLDVAALGTGVELARAPDLLLRIGDHLVPLGDPADGACQREYRRKEAHRNADRPLHNARVEVDVGIELALHEVIVFKR